MPDTFFQEIDLIIYFVGAPFMAPWGRDKSRPHGILAAIA
jgi:hypothetical protein